jgi:soluble lytic murein transglycosylase-like protein
MADPLASYEPIFQAAGQEWNVDPLLLRSLAAQESGGKPNAVSKAGAQGLMQIMPETQKYLGITDPTDPVQSIFGAAKYLSEGLDKEGSPEGALLFYHGGPDWKSRFGPESAAYVPAVAARYKALLAAQPPVAATPPQAAVTAPDATPAIPTQASR